MTKYFTVSVTLFILTGLVFVFQWIPFTGIFLMFMLAMVWSVVLLNLAFVAMLVECALGILPRALIIMPLGYFLGYSWFAYQSRIETEAIVAQAVLDAEEFRKTAYNGQPVLFSNQSMASELLSASVPQVYWRDDSGDTGALQLVNKAQCAALKQRLTEETARLATAYKLNEKPYDGWLGLSVQDYSYNKAEPLNESYCRFTYPAVPPANATQIVISDDRIVAMLGVQRSLTQYSVQVEGQPERRFMTGRVSALGYFPMPMMGCYLDSGTPKWRCSVGFMRSAYKKPQLSALNGDKLLEAWLSQSKAEWPELKLEAIFTSLQMALREDELARLARLADDKSTQPASFAFRLPNLSSSGFPELIKHPELVPASVASALTLKLINPDGRFSPQQRSEIEALLALLPVALPAADLDAVARQLRNNSCAVHRNWRHPPAMPALEARYAEAIYQADLEVITAALADPVAVNETYRRRRYSEQNDHPFCMLTAHTAPTRLAPLIPQMLRAIKKMLATAEEPLRQGRNWEYEYFTKEIGLVLTAVSDDQLAPHKPALAALIASSIDPNSSDTMAQYFPAAPGYYLADIIPGLGDRLKAELLAEEQQRLEALLPLLLPSADEAEPVSLEKNRHIFVQLVQQPEHLRAYATPLVQVLISFIKASQSRVNGWKDAFALPPNYTFYIPAHLLQALPEDAWRQIRPALVAVIAQAPALRHNYEHFVPAFFTRLDQAP